MIIKSAKDEIQNYLVDASNTKGFCEAVYIPENVDEVIEVLKEANSKKLSVTVSGNRTGLTGACVPKGGIVLSTEKLNRFLDLDIKEKSLLLEPGILLSDLKNEVESKDLFYPPDPTELNCFIGGTIATNASGARTFKYGPTRNYVEELEIVLPEGELIHLKRSENIADGFNLTLTTNSYKKIELTLPDYEMPKTKNASGYYCKRNMDAVDLFIGSEGTLGVITKIGLKLLFKPKNIISCVVFFNSENDALNFLTEVRDESYRTRSENRINSIDATALEFFDHNALEFLLADYPNIPGSAQAAIWFEQEYEGEEDLYLELWLSLINKHNGNEEDVWIALDEKEKRSLKQFRHAISENVNEYISRNNFRKLGTDVAVPDEKFIEFYYSTKKLVESEQIDYVTYGHFGNSHIHLNILPKTDEEFEKGQRLYKQICLSAIKSGGTFSAEHGVGKNKTDLLIEMYGRENINKMKALKKKLDPNYIFGVGNIFKST